MSNTLKAWPASINHCTLPTVEKVAIYSTYTCMHKAGFNRISVFVRGQCDSILLYINLPVVFVIRVILTVFVLEQYSIQKLYNDSITHTFQHDYLNTGS